MHEAIAARVTSARPLHGCRVGLVGQHSTSACLIEKTFGCIDEQNIWVSGCRGAFRCGEKRDGGEGATAASVFFCGYPMGKRTYNCSCNAVAHEQSIASPARLGPLSTTLSSSLPVYQQLHPRSSPIERACKLVVFKHITKAGGTTLSSWFHELQVLGWFNFFSTWTGNSSICPFPLPRKCAVEHFNSRQTSRMHAYILSQFEARILRRDGTLADGWFGSIQPSNVPLRIPLRAVLEIHATDWHMAHLIDSVDSMRPLAATSGCGALALMIWRSPTAQYVSLYKYDVVFKQEKRRFEEFAAANMHYQTMDLLRGTTYWQHYFTNKGDGDTRVGLLRTAALSYLAHFDLVAPLERFSDLLGQLCLWLALPYCPCYKVQNAERRRDYEQLIARHAQTRNDSGLLAASQDARILRNQTALKQLISEVAWVDEQIYDWVVVSFFHRTAAKPTASVTACRSRGKPVHSGKERERGRERERRREKRERERKREEKREEGKGGQ